MYAYKIHPTTLPSPPPTPAMYSYLRKRRERPFTHAFLPSRLPAAERPTDNLSLSAHLNCVNAIAALPDGARVATACIDGHLRVFGLSSDFGPHPRGRLLQSIASHEEWLGDICALGGDIVAASGGGDGMLATFRASTGERVGRLSVSGDSATGMAVVRHGCFVVGVKNGAHWDLVWLSHDNGRELMELLRVTAVHQAQITAVVSHSNILVTTSFDKTAAVWNASTAEKRANLCGHLDWVNCAAVNDRVIATGSDDKTVRVYRNGRDFSLLAALTGLHRYSVYSVTLLGNGLLMSTAWDSTIFFTVVPERGLPSCRARINAGFDIGPTAVLQDGRIVVGEPGTPGRVALFESPHSVSRAVQSHAASLFPPMLPQPVDEEAPSQLQDAMVRVNAGLLSAGEACRDVVTRENCSKSINEWWHGHVLLMTAIRRGEISTGRHYGNAKLHWLEQLYTPKMPLPMGSKDRALVKSCLLKAEEVGVIQSADAALAFIQGNQDLTHEVSKLQEAGKDMLRLISRVLLQQACTDSRLDEFSARLRHLTMVHGWTVLCQAIFSFVPLGSGLATGAVAAALEFGENVPQLIESIMGGVVGAAEAAAPMILDKEAKKSGSLVEVFLSGAGKMLSAEVWKEIPEELRVNLRKAAEELGMSWDEFRELLSTAAAQQNCLQGVDEEVVPIILEDTEDGEDFRLAVEYIQHGDGEEAMGEGCAAPLCFVHGSEGNQKIPNAEKSAAQLAASQADNLQVVSGGRVFDGPSDCKRRVDCVECSLEDLRVACLSRDDMRCMGIPSLARWLAGAMVNFRTVYRERFEILDVILGRVITNLCLDGDAFVDLNQQDQHVYEFLLEGLRNDEAYQALQNMGVCELRLKKFVRQFREP